MEIGSFLGGGTAKLARFFAKYNKMVFAVDIFDPAFDDTENLNGNSMSTLYSRVLRGRNQDGVFREKTRKYRNVFKIKGDSRQVTLPCREICFSFVDGCHDPDYVQDNHHLVGDKTVSGGVLAFHDCGRNLTQTTGTTDQLIEVNKDSIEESSQIA